MTALALENRLHTARELLELATAKLMRRAPDRPMMFRFADGTAGSVESDRWRRESAGQTAMLTLCRMLDAGEIVPRGPFGTPTVIGIMPDQVERSCALDRADAGLYLAALGIAVEDARPAEVHELDEPTQQRFDDLRAELESILRKMAASDERITAGTVMPKLRARIGIPGTCIIDQFPDGVLWSRGTGTPEKLTTDMLAKRIDRWKDRNTPKTPR